MIDDFSYRVETSWKNRLAASVRGDVADFVDDDEPVAADFAEFGLEAVGAVGFGQSGDPAGGRGERDAVPGVEEA